MIKHNITQEDYFSADNQMKYISNSQIKDFMSCEACALAKAKGEYAQSTSTALLVGSYVDAYVEGTIDIFKANNPSIFKRDGTLKADYVQADYIIERIQRDELFMRALDGEKQRIMVGEIEGVPIKIKIDSYREHKTIVDLKVVKDFAPIYVNKRGKLPFYEAWGYDIQGAIYQEIVRQNTGETLPFVLAAVTKETEPDMMLMSIDQCELDTALSLVKDNIRRYNDIKNGLIQPESCGCCNYCKQHKKLSKVINSEEFKNGYSD